MAIIADMHTHTSCSDGMLAPKALVSKAMACGLQVLAITDHDTIDGVEPAIEAAQGSDLTIIPGVELSIHFLGRELHLLGYHFDPQNQQLIEFLFRFQKMRYERAQEMVERLQELGVKLTFEDVASLASGPAIGRPHVAQALVAKKYVDTLDQAFLKYLRNRGPADVPKKLPTAQEAIDVLHAADGIAVLAHPGHWVSDKDLERLQHIGMDGVEVIHPSHDEMLVNFYVEVAHRLSLLTTGGSDYHGMRTHDEKNFGVYGLTHEQFHTLQRKRAA